MQLPSVSRQRTVQRGCRGLLRELLRRCRRYRTAYAASGDTAPVVPTTDGWVASMPLQPGCLTVVARARVGCVWVLRFGGKLSDWLDQTDEFGFFAPVSSAVLG